MSALLIDSGEANESIAIPTEDIAVPKEDNEPKSPMSPLIHPRLNNKRRRIECDDEDEGTYFAHSVLSDLLT